MGRDCAGDSGTAVNKKGDKHVQNDEIYQYCQKQRQHLLDDIEALEGKERSNSVSSHLRVAAAAYGDVLDFIERLQQKEKSRSLREQTVAQK